MIWFSNMEKTMKQEAFNFDLERIKSRVEDDFVAVPNFENRDDLIKWLEQKMNVELGKHFQQ